MNAKAKAVKVPDITDADKQMIRNAHARIQQYVGEIQRTQAAIQGVQVFLTDHLKQVYGDLTQPQLDAITAATIGPPAAPSAEDAGPRAPDLPPAIAERRAKSAQVIPLIGGKKRKR